MALKDLALWNRRDKEVDRDYPLNPVESLHREVDRWFDGFFNDFGRFPGSLFNRGRIDSFSPKVDISEDDAEVTISAELPGMNEKDIQVNLKDDVLTIRGEKKNEFEDKDKDKQYYRYERSYGSFQRSIQLPGDIDADKIKASFKNGVLNVSLPKSEKAKENVKQIEVKSA